MCMQYAHGGVHPPHQRELCPSGKLQKGGGGSTNYSIGLIVMYVL